MNHQNMLTEISNIKVIRYSLNSNYKLVNDQLNFYRITTFRLYIHCKFYI